MRRMRSVAVGAILVVALAMVPTGVNALEQADPPGASDDGFTAEPTRQSGLQETPLRPSVVSAEEVEPQMVTPLSGRVQARFSVDVPGVASAISPNDGLDVRFYMLDAAADVYRRVPVDGEWTYLGEPAGWLSPELPTGTYVIRFFPGDPAIGMQWWSSARYFDESTELGISEQATADLGDVVLGPWLVDIARIAGADRFATAVAISKMFEKLAGTPRTVYLANGLNYPDALAAGPAAIDDGAAMLLTAPTSLPAVTRAELARPQPTRIVVVGGTGAISDSVLKAVRTAVPSAAVSRVAGATRYETADRLVRATFEQGNQPTVYIATGRGYPDALAAGAAAGYLGAPVLLLDGAASKLDARSSALLQWLGTQEAVIVGGTGAVSAGIEQSLRAKLGWNNVYRDAGDTRYDTAATVNTNTFGPTDYTFVASGLNYPDALAGVPLAGALGASVYLTPPTCLYPGAVDGMAWQRPNGFGLLGGTGALSGKVAELVLCR